MSPVILSVQAMDKFIHYLFGPIWVLENMNRNLILGSHKHPMNSKGDRYYAKKSCCRAQRTHPIKTMLMGRG